MKEYSVIIQVSAGFSARNQGEAQERANQILDLLGLCFNGPQPKWMPEEVEKEISSVQEQ